MDPIFTLINKIDSIINTTDNDKIENIIKNDILYNNLNTIEKDIVLEIIQDKITNKNNKIQKLEIKNKSKNKSIPIMIANSDGVNISEGEALSSKANAILLAKITDEEYEFRSTIFNKLKAIILPEQRSPEWFAMRSGKITASDGGAVLGKNKHEPCYNFILKKVFGSTFETNLACYHGKKLEFVVTLMYEYVNNVHTEEFGLLGHPDYYFIGASPDGIVSPYCRDKKTPTPLVGRMLEIKCPLMRKIKYSGNIIDTICPVYYWCQVQLQLECCNLDECDFVQCNIEEYSCREDWLNDTSQECDFKSKKYGLERGVIIELLPTNLNESDYNGTKIADKTIYDKASFLYPPKIDMSLNELDNWILEKIANLQNTPEVRLHRVIYWRLIERNCTLIKRDREWFAANLEQLRTMWSYVEFLRKNLDVAEEWKNWINSLQIKYTDKIIDKLKELINIKKNPVDLLQINNNVTEEVKELVKEEIKEELVKVKKVKKVEEKDNNKEDSDKKVKKVKKLKKQEIEIEK